MRFAGDLLEGHVVDLGSQVEHEEDEDALRVEINYPERWRGTDGQNAAVESGYMDTFPSTDGVAFFVMSCLRKVHMAKQDKNHLDSDYDISYFIIQYSE